MAIATIGGHISRAIDFYKNAKNGGTYFIIGGTKPWIEGDATPPIPNVNDYKLVDVIGLKKVDSVDLVAKDERDIVPADDTRAFRYNNTNWRRVDERLTTTTYTAISAGDTVISVTTTGGLTKYSKIRINNQYEGTIIEVTGNINTTQITLDTPAPTDIPTGSLVQGGAEIEKAKYVYLSCQLSYPEFPLVNKFGTPLSYRQVGICTGVVPGDSNVLLSADMGENVSVNQYTSLGILEILDNRKPINREADQSESLSLIIEF